MDTHGRYTYNTCTQKKGGEKRRGKKRKKVGMSEKVGIPTKVGKNGIPEWLIGRKKGRKRPTNQPNKQKCGAACIKAATTLHSKTLRLFCWCHWTSCCKVQTLSYMYLSVFCQRGENAQSTILCLFSWSQLDVVSYIYFCIRTESKCCIYIQLTPDLTRVEISPPESLLKDCAVAKWFSLWLVIRSH